MRKRELIPSHIKYTFFIYLLGLICFTIFRLILFLTEIDRIDNIAINERYSVIIKSFFMGFRFDAVVSGYILSLPFISLAVISLFRKRSLIFYNVIFWYTFLIYSIAFLICAIDIPFFNQFFSRLSIVSLQWIESPSFVAMMILQEFRYWWAIIPYTLVLLLFYFLSSKITNKNLTVDNSNKYESGLFAYYVKNILFSVLFALIMFAGIRGRLEQKSPIRVGSAYFSNYPFPNQLGLNPVFTFINSIIYASKEENKNVSLIDYETAIENVKKYLNIKTSCAFNSPIARMIHPEMTTLNKHNVVIVIMESMGTAKMGRYGNKKNLTPNLDSLANKGYAFDHIYTAGIHTFNGVYSTIFSFPAIFRQHPMKEVSMLKYSGLGTTLKKHDYSAIYFTTHDDQFDNIGGFLKSNDFEEIISQKDFPHESIKSTLGVPDDYMFEFSIPILNKFHNRSKPFIAVYMTASDHGPYVIPDYFQPKQEKVKDQIVEYADWSIGKFLQLCSKQLWFENTLFVFIADHGNPISSTYDMPLDYHHTPLIFYGPNILYESGSFDCLGGQIDVFPTIMGILKLPYINNTFGIDLLHETRPFIYFCADDKFGILNKEYFLVVRDDGFESLYKYKDSETENYLEGNKYFADIMKTYAKSNIQAAQWLIRNRKTNTD